MAHAVGLQTKLYIGEPPKYRMTRDILYWMPRIFVMLFAAFLAIFSFDVFGTGEPWYLQAAGFLIHNIPSLVLLGLLWFAWHNERLGGIIFLALAVLFTGFILWMNRDAGAWLLLILPLICGPMFLIGVLFLLQGREKAHQNGTERKRGP